MSKAEAGIARWRIELVGTVQGVGFRPFVHRLASELSLSGWARNARSGLQIELEGHRVSLELFVNRLATELPRHAEIAQLEQWEIARIGDSEFRIVTSSLEERGAGSAEIVPDLATCPGCLQEIFDESDRRYLYPFTNCVNCGPRFSIILETPYDRERTTMKPFEMCPLCREEFESPQNRRFHAQPNACPTCGPQLSWTDRFGSELASMGDAIESASKSIEEGNIVAVKGIGGFHLLADAGNKRAIQLLRDRKGRKAKPLAIMLPSIEAARDYVSVSTEEAELLASPMAPIVILNRQAECPLPETLAPGNPTLGVMLPYSPVHHILIRRLGFPLIATSGNLGEEPICIGNEEALSRLGNIADGFLMHDRRIARPLDDSVARVAAGREMVLRRSRGYAPKGISVAGARSSTLAIGGDLKNTIAVAQNETVWLSQHIGDLSSLESRETFEKQLVSFPELMGIEPKAIACDRHPGYHSRNGAKVHPLPQIELQHHFCHAAACLAENGVNYKEKALAVIWDGTGFGDDKTIWGGEFLLCHNNQYERIAWLKPFLLPGGEKGVRDPRFAALGCLHEAGIDLEDTCLDSRFSAEERAIGKTMIKQGLNTILCSSAGRLFDAVSALCGLQMRNDFEGQAAMALEFAARKEPADSACGIELDDTSGAIDWTPILRQVIEDLDNGSEAAKRAPSRFHLSLAKLIADVAGSSECNIVALTGGCFQNILLLESTIERLRKIGKEPIWHRIVPPNDGGLAFGQAVIASRGETIQS